MKLLLFIVLFSINIYCQTSSVNCDSLIYEEHRGCLYVETMAEPVGGIDSLQSRLIYPTKALENNIEGKVYVIVVIDSIGNQFCTKVIKSLGYGCDEEALRLVKTSKFIPGTLRGKPYTMPVSIPIIFSHTDEN